MSKELEGLLESVARELSKQEERWFNDDTEPSVPHVQMVIEVLKHRLLPLLEAGQDHACDNNSMGCSWNAARREAGKERP